MYTEKDFETHSGIEKMITNTREDGTVSFIPKDEANADYQAYLKWLEENN